MLRLWQHGTIINPYYIQIGQYITHVFNEEFASILCITIVKAKSLGIVSIDKI